MIVGILEVEVYVYEANSLKEKRSVIKSLIERLRSRFNISIAEIALNDKWNRSIIGISVISNDTIQVNKVLSKVMEFIYGDTRVEVVCENIEIL